MEDAEIYLAKDGFFLSDKELKLIADMIEGGTFSGQGVELVAALKQSIALEIERRAHNTRE